MLEARQTASALSGQIQASGVAVGGFGRMAEMSGREVAMSARHFRSLFEELKAGNASGAEVTVLRLAASVLRLGPAALGALAGIGALVGGFAYFIVKAIEAANAAERFRTAAAIAGNNVPVAEIRKLADAISESAEISSAQALKIAGSLGTIPQAGEQARAGLAVVAREMAEEFNVPADKIGETIHKMFAPETSAADAAKELARTTGADLTGAQVLFAEAADRSNNSVTVQAAKLQLVNEIAQRGSQSYIEHASSIHASWTNLAAYVAEGEQGLDATTDMVEDQTRHWERNKAAIAAATAQLAEQAKAGQPKDVTLKIGIQVAQGENPVAKQTDEAQQKIDKLTAALPGLQSQLAQLQLNPALKAEAEEVRRQIEYNIQSTQQLRERMAELTLGPAVERMRTEMQQVAATWDGTQEAMLQKQLTIAQGTLAKVSGDAKARGEVEQEVARLEVQINQAASQQIVEAVHARNSAIQSDTQQSETTRLEAVRENLLEELSTAKLTASARKQLEQEINTTSVQLARAAATQKEAIERSDLETDVAITRLHLEAKKDEIQQELAAHQLSASQKLAILSSLTTQEEQQEERLLQDEIKHLTEGTAAYAEAYNKIRELRARLNADLAKLEQQAAADTLKEIRDQATAWKDAVSEIEGAETGLISSVLSRRKTLGQALYQEASKVADQEIESFVRAETTRMLLGDKDKALEQGGLLYHLFTQQEKTAASLAGAATRANADTLEASRATVTDQSQVLSYGAAQAQMTGATACGTATRTGIQQSGSTGFFSHIAQMLAKWFGFGDCQDCGHRRGGRRSARRCSRRQMRKRRYRDGDRGRLADLCRCGCGGRGGRSFSCRDPGGGLGDGTRRSRRDLRHGHGVPRRRRAREGGVGSAPRHAGEHPRGRDGYPGFACRGAAWCGQPGGGVRRPWHGGCVCWGVASGCQRLGRRGRLYGSPGRV